MYWFDIRARRGRVDTCGAFTLVTTSTPNPRSRIYPRLARTFCVLFLAIACLGPWRFTVSAQEGDSGTPTSLTGDTATDEPCFDGRLRVRDLERADPYLPKGLTRVHEAGKAWESDAILYSLRLGCPLLEPGFQLEGTFFSATAQAFYSTGTGEIQASDDRPGTITGLDTSNGITVAFVYKSLVRAGLDPNSLLDVASGVTIQANTVSHPFGPPSAPAGAVYYHVAVIERGEVRDIWVSSADGNVYRYTSN